MLRRKKINNQTTKPPKTVEIFFSQTATSSPHFLDLREKLSPTPLSSLDWQPSSFDRLLARPLAYFKPSTASPPRRLVAEEGILNYQTEAITGQPKRQRFLTRALPRWRVKWPDLPQFNLPQFKFPQLYLPFPRLICWQKALAGFILFGLLFTLPIPTFSAYYELRGTQDKILQAGTAAFQHLSQGKAALATNDFLTAGQELQTALELFSQTQNQINEINPGLRALLSILPHWREKYLNGEHLLMAGQHLTLTALPLLQAVNSAKTSEPLTEQLDAFSVSLTQIIPKFQLVQKHLDKVNADFIPLDQQSSFLALRRQIDLLSGDFQKIQPLLPLFNEILGAKEKKRYLLIFQNNNEIRPTGGFIGSFALLDLEKGKIKNLDIPGGGPYEMQGSLKTALLPPAPLQLLKSRWEFQDANWFPDFPASAKKIAWFYEKSGGPTVDGVIALDTYVMLDLLKITGEIYMPEYNKTIKAENFIFETQKQVEMDYDRALNKPKQFLADMAPKIIDKLSHSGDFLTILNVFNKNLNEKHVQLYFSETNVEKEIIPLGWAGQLKDNPNGDYIAVVNANIAGGKTDGVIKQNIRHQAKIEPDGSIINTVTIVREHQGRSDDLFFNLQNVDYLRLYVPRGSTLIQATGFHYPEEKHFKVPEKWYKMDEDLKQIERAQIIDEASGTVITQEFNKTSFGNWVLTKPGQTTAVSFSYKLPFKLRLEKSSSWFRNDYPSYSLLIQKQAGTVADNFSSSISLPPQWQIIWSDLPVAIQENNRLSFSDNLAEDRFFNFVAKTE